MSAVPIFRRPLRFRFLGALAVAALLAYQLWLYPPTQAWLPFPGRDREATAVFRANSTLGFGNIYVVSKDDSPRRHGLLQAANVTELDLTIPVQPKWTPEFLDSYPRVGKGSLMAWLGHLHSLRLFLESGAETALILEDDVDWDIRLRSLQVPLVATALRTILSSEPDLSPTSRYPGELDDDAEAIKYPYGDPKRWDLLYMGHCGDYWHGTDRGFDDGHVKPDDLARTMHVSFNDTSLPDFDNLHPWTASLLRNLGVPVHTRLVHRSVFPLCSFAYAVTRDSARLLVDELLSLDKGDHPAYDVAILVACRDTPLRCWTVNPELFHHLPGKSIIGNVENITHTPPVDASARDIVELRGETANIDCGFWKGDFSFPDGNTRRLAFLRNQVGHKGRCLKNGRY